MSKIKKKIITSILSTALIFQPVIFNQPNNLIVAEAHSGRTDSSGGHHDNKNKSGLGSYHYHCGGNPAHLHTGGVCPYSNNITATSGGGTFSGAVSQSSSSQTSSSSSSNKIKLSTGDTVTLDNDLVKIIQDVLNQKGYDCGTPDGIAGSKTKNAVEQFMEENKDSDNTDFLIISMAAEALGVD